MEIPKIHKYRYKAVRFILKKANRIILPGVNGASLYEVGYIFVKKVFDTRLAERCAAVTYNFVMALPPMLLFIFSLLPYLPIKHVDQTVLYVLKIITPNTRIYSSVSELATDFMNKQHHDALSSGILLVLYFASNGMVGLMKSFDYNASLFIERTPWQRRFRAIKLTLVLIFINIIAMTVFVIQTKSLNPVILHIFHTLTIVKMLSSLIMLAVVFIGISVIYTYGPSMTHRFRFVSFGSVFATLASLVVTSVFFFLINHFLNYDRLYGTIGSLIAFMVLIWLNTVIILVGYELNVSLLLGKLSQESDEIE